MKRTLVLFAAAAMLLTFLPSPVQAVPVTWTTPYVTDVLLEKLNPKYGKSEKFLEHVDMNIPPVGLPVDSVEDLLKIGVDTMAYPDGLAGSYYLTCDIDLNGVYWVPLGVELDANSKIDTITPFTGTFDGRGYEIKNLTIKDDDEDYPWVDDWVENSIDTPSDPLYLGLFAQVSDATIKNLGLLGISISVCVEVDELSDGVNPNPSSINKEPVIYAGGLFGYSSAGSSVTVYNCYTTGSFRLELDIETNVTVGSSYAGSPCVTTASPQIYAGGLYGFSGGKADVASSYNLCGMLTVVSGNATAVTSAATSIEAQAAAYPKAYTGGIFAYGAGETTVSKCFNRGTVTSSGSSAATAQVSGASTPYTMDDELFVYTGGICAFTNEVVNIHNSFNESDISASALAHSGVPNNAAGGIIGHSQNYATISNCFNNLSAVSAYYAGGIYGSSASFAAISDSCNTGDISGSQSAGGIYGYSYSSAASVQRAYNTGDIDGGGHAGGIYGYSNSSVLINDCYNRGDVNATYAGGIIGYNNGAVEGAGSSAQTVGNCYSTGLISGSQNGGICGYNLKNGNSVPADILPTCYWSSTLSSTSLGVAEGEGNPTPCPEPDMKLQRSYIGFIFNSVWMHSPANNNGYPYLRANNNDTGIDYPPYEEHVIVPGRIDPDATGAEPEAIINLDTEKMTIYLDNFSIRTYSKDGGKTWKKARNEFSEKNFPKLLNKGVELHLANTEIDKTTRQPIKGGTIIQFPHINKRPPALKSVFNYGHLFIALTPNYSLGADPSGYDTGTWILGGVYDKYLDPVYTTYADLEPLQIGIADITGRNVNEMGFGKFYADETGQPVGIPVERFYNKSRKTYYFIRIAPSYRDGVYTAASKPKRVSAKSASRPSTYKLKKDGTLKIRAGTYVKIGDSSPVLYTERTVVDIGFYSRVSIWTAATTKKPASEKQVIPPLISS